MARALLTMNNLIELIKFLFSACLIMLPGVGLAHLCFPQRSPLERWIRGGPLGLALAVYLAFACSTISINLFWPAWFLICIAVLLLCRRLRPALFKKPDPLSAWLIGILFLVAVCRFTIALFHLLPPGWDASFHLVLAKKINMNQGMIHDWRPFADASLHYPLGSHFLIVTLASISQLPLHTVFKFLIPFLGVLTTALIYVFTRHTFNNKEMAVYAALAYGLWANYGSIDYYRWGGLPNLLGMLFLLSLLTVLLEPPSRRSIPLVALYFCAIFFTHHHVMITTLCILAVIFAFRKSQTLLYGLLGGLALGCFYVIPFASKIFQLGNTTVLSFPEELYTLPLIWQRAGPIFACFAVGGLLFYALRKSSSPSESLLCLTSATLMGLFILFEYIYRILAMWIWGNDWVAFTPSRFFTDLIYFLCCFAGFGLFRLRNLLKGPVAAIMVAGILFSLTNLPIWKSQFHTHVLNHVEWEAFQWVEANTRTDTIVYNDHHWVSYGTGRRSAFATLPVSEPALKNSFQNVTRGDIIQGKLAPELRAFPIIEFQLIEDTRKPANVLWRHPSGLAVVEIWRGNKT